MNIKPNCKLEDVIGAIDRYSPIKVIKSGKKIKVYQARDGNIYDLSYACAWLCGVSVNQMDHSFRLRDGYNAGHSVVTSIKDKLGFDLVYTVDTI